MQQLSKETNNHKGVNLEICLEQLRYHLSQVVEKSNDLRPTADLSASYENFLRTCDEVRHKLHIHDPTFSNKQKNGDIQNCLDKVCDCVDIEQSPEECKRQQFLSSCKQTKAKTDGQHSGDIKQNKDKQVNVQVNTALTDNKNENIFGYIKKMISDRQFFKAKDQEKKPPSSEDPLSKIVDQINETQNLAREAKINGCMSDSLEEFMKSCEKLKDKLGKKRQKALMKNICSICKSKEMGNEEYANELISRLKAAGLISDSIENFLRVQLATQTGSYNDKTTKSEETATCSKHREMTDDETESAVTPSCNFCQKKIGQNGKYEDMNIKTDKITEPTEGFETEDDSLGLYEKNVHKIVKVTRTLKDDGKVLEKKQVTIIKKNRHDPQGTQFPEVGNTNDDSGAVVEKTVTTIIKKDS